MSQIIKVFTGIYILLFLMSAGMGLLGAFLQTLQAQNLHGMVIDELENSDYAPSVLEGAFDVVEGKVHSLWCVFTWKMELCWIALRQTGYRRVP